MKINIFFSVVKAISAWLHGEGSRHFRTFTYPRIKQISRRVINLGLYEHIEKFYKIVDDTYYQGVVEPGPFTTPEEVFQAEQLASVVEDGAINIDFSSRISLPKLSDIRKNLIIWKGPEQGRTYRCGTFTMNNMLRSFMLARGLKPPLEVTAIDPLYIATKHGKGQTGTVMNHAFSYLAKKGFPVASWTPMMTDHNKELSNLEKSLVIGNASLFPTIRATGNVKTTYKFEEAVELDRTLPDNWSMQVSINFSASLNYFGQLVPGLKKVNGKYSLIRTGGHSVHGVRGSFSLWEDKEPGFVIVESAYRSSEDGWRFLKAKLFDYGVLVVRFVELDAEGHSVAPVTPQPPETPSNPPTTITDQEILAHGGDITFGDNNANVLALQKFLLASGYAIPDGPTTFFGRQTQVALKNWQDAQFGAKYDGTVWGPISRQRYIEISRLG